jgi:DNA-binding transcriptional MerR regulator
VPDKRFFKIGEVSELLGVRPHVLRYWESEFSALRPLKTRGAHRMYRREDVELAMMIRRLLHDERYTIPGARKKLRESGHLRRGSEPDPGASRELSLRAELLAIRDDLTQLLDELDAVQAHRGDPPAVVTVERVIPIPVAVPVRARG